MENSFSLFFVNNIKTKFLIRFRLFFYILHSINMARKFNKKIYIEIFHP